MIQAIEKETPLVGLGYAPSQAKQMYDAMESHGGAIVIACFMQNGYAEVVDELIRVGKFPSNQVKHVGCTAGLNQKNVTQRMMEIYKSNPLFINFGHLVKKTAPELIRATESGLKVIANIDGVSVGLMIPMLNSERFDLWKFNLSKIGTFSLLISQRRVPLLCIHCSESSDKTKDKAALKMLGAVTDKRSNHKFRWQKIGGCDACQGVGVTGRTIIAETFIPDSWHPLYGGNINAGADDLRNTEVIAEPANMTGRSLLQHAKFKVINGLIDPRTIFDDLDWINTIDAT
jgi:hypothetical protein